MPANAGQVLRPLIGGGEELVSLHANFQLIWMERTWVGEATRRARGFDAYAEMHFDGAYFRMPDGRYGRIDGPVPPEDYWSHPGRLETAEQAVEALRAEADRLAALHGAPIAGHRLIAADGNGVRLEAATMRRELQRERLGWLMETKLRIPWPLGLPFGWLYHFLHRYLLKERTV